MAAHPGCPLPSPEDAWDRLQLSPVTLGSGLDGSEKRMNETMFNHLRPWAELYINWWINYQLSFYMHLPTNQNTTLNIIASMSTQIPLFLRLRLKKNCKLQRSQSINCTFTTFKATSPLWRWLWTLAAPPLHTPARLDVLSRCRVIGCLADIVNTRPNIVTSEGGQ